MNQDEKDYVNWMNGLLRPKGNLAEGLEELARLKEENAQLRALVDEYRRLVNTYHEDLAPIRNELEKRAEPFLEGNK